MKVECPICGAVGVLQQRGRSYRVQHYMGFKDGRRLYSYHAVDRSVIDLMEVNGSKTVEVKNPEKTLISAAEGAVAGGVGFEPTTPTLGG